MKSPFFKAVCIYRLARDVRIVREEFHAQLAQFEFTPCAAQDMARSGWVNVIPYSLAVEHDGSYLLCYQGESKIIPAPVVYEDVARRVSKIESEQARKIRRAERLSLKDEALHSLLPRAFSKTVQHYIWIDTVNNLVFVDSGSARTAENVLALLRKTIGSLPVVPYTMATPIELTLTEWVRSGEMAAGFTLMDETELKAILEGGGVIRCKQQELVCDEIAAHIETGKVVTKLALDWQKRIQFVLADDCSIKRLKFADTLHEQNNDIERDDIYARMMADFILFKAEFSEMLVALTEALGGECAR